MSVFTYDHTHLYSADPASTAKFYQDLLQGEVIKTHDDGRVDLRVGGQPLFISPLGTGTPASDVSGARNHLGFVVQDLVRTVQELKSKGAIFSKDPVEIRPGVKIAFLNAPDGLEVELLQRG